MSNIPIIQARSPFQQAAGDPRFYNVRRDFAYLGPEVVINAINDLTGNAANPTTPDPWFVSLMTHFGVSSEAVGKGVERFAAAMALILDREDPMQPDRAFAESGFSGVPGPVQAAILVYVAKHNVSALWDSVRSAYMVGGEAETLEKQLQRMEQAGQMTGRQLAERFDKLDEYKQ